jgi:hypothetical protein
LGTISHHGKSTRLVFCGLCLGLFLFGCGSKAAPGGGATDGRVDNAAAGTVDGEVDVVDVGQPSGCECPALTLCRQGECVDGECVESVAVGQVCDDGNACNQSTTCNEDAQCGAGESVLCESDEPCSIALCDPEDGCTFEQAENGQPCHDGNSCTFGDACLSGVCGGSEKVCDDGGNPCTVPMVLSCTMLDAVNKWVKNNATEGGGCTEGAAMFTDAGNGDYSLHPDSPCVDAGDPLMKDLDGSPADMGATGGPLAE